MNMVAGQEDLMAEIDRLDALPIAGLTRPETLIVIRALGRDANYLRRKIRQKLRHTDRPAFEVEKLTNQRAATEALKARLERSYGQFE